MEYAAVQNLIKTNVEALPYDVMFGHGREADFNQLRDRVYPLVWLDPMEHTKANPNTFNNTERWTISIVFLVKGKADDTSTIQNTLVNSTDQIAEDFIKQLDSQDGLEFGNEPSIRPFHRTTLGVEHTSGCVLTFQLIVYDTYVC